MIREWKAVVTVAVALGGSMVLGGGAGAAVGPLDARSATPMAEAGVRRVAANGSTHAVPGVPGMPPAVAGHGSGHGRRAEREAKRAARKLQRRMRKQQEQELLQQPPADAH
ncbi:hypothetical protein K2Z84_21000 [Candidatus Binatia bacterium]|nr:hypothetical protein [Candidatus Binatia bacterium]